jgi:hypothetical protein
MTPQFSALFTHTHAELSRNGRRGGRIAARLRRQTRTPRAPKPAEHELKAPIEVSIAQLDRDFPHLRGAEHGI